VFAGGQQREAQAGQVQWLVTGAPARGSGKRAASILVTALEVQHAAERPKVKGAPRGRTDAAADAQVLDGFFALAKAQTGARGVLASDVEHDRRLQHLFGDRQSVRETPPLHVRKIELPQQKDARRM